MAGKMAIVIFSERRELAEWPIKVIEKNILNEDVTLS